VSRPTMDEIARDLGLSRVTISSVVNNNGLARGISEGTIQRVREYLLQIGFVPSRAATHLRSGATNCIGIFHSGGLYSHVTEAFNRITRGLSDSLRRVEIMIVPRGDIVEGLRELLARGTTRLIWFHSSGSLTEISSPMILNYLSNCESFIYNYHFACDDNSAELESRKIHLIGVDRYAGFTKLAHFLKRLGHGAVALPELSLQQPSDIREQAFLASGLIPIRTRPRNVNVEVSREAGTALGKAVFKELGKGRITAACFNDDFLAGYAIAELTRAGVRVPQDLTVTGYDGLEIATAFQVPLTTLAVPVCPMISKVQTLLDGGGDQFRHVFQLELIKRDSHGETRHGRA
jgi:DNA-binding LacI/PurR family transcriptional regulator